VITDATCIHKIIDETTHAPKLVSVCIPSRGRVKLLKELVESLLRTVSDLSRIEIIFRVDEDDPDTIEYVSQVLNAIVVVGSSVGYDNHQSRINDMFAVAKGRYLLLTGDDHRWQTNGWDDYLQKRSEQIAVVFFGKDTAFAVHSSLPKVWEKCGAYSYSIDVMYKYLALRLGIYVSHENVEVVDIQLHHSPLTPIPIPGHEENWRLAKKEVDEFIDLMSAYLLRVGTIPNTYHAGTIMELFGLPINSQPSGMPTCIG